MVGPINDGTVQKTVDKSNASSYVGSEKTTTHEVVAWKTISFRNIWLMTSVNVRVPVAFPDLWLHRAVSKKECSQVPVVSEKLGPILHPRSCRSFAVAPFQPRISLHYMLLIFQHILLPTVPQSKVPCNHGVFSFVWETSWAAECATAASTNNVTTVIVRDGQEHTSPHPGTKRRAVCAEKSRLEKCLEQTNKLIPFGWKQRPINTSAIFVNSRACHYVAYARTPYDPLRSCLAE